MTISPINTSVTASLGTADSTVSGSTGTPLRVSIAPNDLGGNTFSISGNATHKPIHISGFRTGTDRLDFSETLKQMGLDSFNNNIAQAKNPGDTVTHYDPKHDLTYIYVRDQSGDHPLKIRVEGEVSGKDIVGYRPFDELT